MGVQILADAWPTAQTELPGVAEYDTIAAVKAAVRIRWYYGDIFTRESARRVAGHWGGSPDDGSG